MLAVYLDNIRNLPSGNKKVDSNSGLNTSCSESSGNPDSRSLLYWHKPHRNLPLGSRKAHSNSGVNTSCLERSGNPDRRLPLYWHESQWNLLLGSRYGWSDLHERTCCPERLWAQVPRIIVYHWLIYHDDHVTWAWAIIGVRLIDQLWKLWSFETYIVTRLVEVRKRNTCIYTRIVNCS